METQSSGGQLCWQNQNQTLVLLLHVLSSKERQLRQEWLGHRAETQIIVHG